MRNIAKALLVVLVVSMAGVAQSKPNITGTWKMNLAKSKFAQGGPEKLTIKFEQKDASLQEWLTIGRPQGDRTMDLSYKTDGIQSTAQVEGQDIKTMAKWDGEELLIVLTDPNGGTFSRRFTIIDGGKAMTIVVRQTGPNGDKDDSVFLEKQ